MKTIFSGIKPSGDLTLGNYIGAISQFIQLQHTHQCYFCVVDLHAITVPQEKLELRKRVKDIAALYIACGLSPSKATIFIQSEVMAHSHLSWILCCNTYLGELNRMTQYKDKCLKENTDAISSGFYTYPVLMAADILLYDAAIVPVGDDQKQHVELTRDIAKRFNNKYGDTFVVPEHYTHKVGARIMDLQDPQKKMSKSDNDKGCILLLDDEGIIRKKIMSAVTDNDMCIKYDKENKPGISNLLSIFSHVRNQPIHELEKEFAGSNYGTFKKALADEMVLFLKPIKERFIEIRTSKELDDILDAGANDANHIANKKLMKVMKKVGFGR